MSSRQHRHHVAAARGKAFYLWAGLDLSVRTADGYGNVDSIGNAEATSMRL